MFVIVSLLGLMVSFIIIVNSSLTNKLSIYLSLLFLTISIFTLTRNFIFYTNYPYILYYFVPGAVPFFYLSAPILYLYVKKSLINSEPEHLKRIEYWHFLPFFISLINILPHLLLSMELKLAFIKALIQNPFSLIQVNTLFYPIELNLLLRPLLGVIYSIMALNIYLGQRQHLIHQDKYRSLARLNWFLFLIICIGMNFLTSLLIGFFAKYSAYQVQNVDEVKLFMLVPTLFLLVLNISIFFFPRMVYGGYRRKTVKREYDPTTLVIQDHSLASITNFPTDPTEIESTFNQISRKLALYFQDKPYLQSGFTLSTISQDTNIPYHQLTAYYNNYLGINFNDWKNNARIDHAIELINDGRAKNLTLESIAITCGFLSRSNFVNSFRKKTGLTPSEYLKSVQ